MQKNKSTEGQKQKNRNRFPPVGMRIWKTVIAVVISSMLGVVLDIHPFYTIIAAILCMQPDREQSIKKGGIRLIGTGVGGVFAVAVLLLIDFTPLESFSVPYYLMISLFVLPLIYTNVVLKTEASSYITCVAFFSIVLSHFEADNHYLFALQRMLETAVGVVISLGVNMVMGKREEEDAKP